MIKKLLSLALLGAVLVGAVQALPPNSVIPWGNPLSTAIWGTGNNLSSSHSGFNEVEAERDAFDSELATVEATIADCKTLEEEWEDEWQQCHDALLLAKYDSGDGPAQRTYFYAQMPTFIPLDKTLQVQSTIYGTNDWEVVFLSGIEYELTCDDWRAQITQDSSGFQWELYIIGSSEMSNFEAQAYHLPKWSEYRGYRNTLKEFGWMVDQYYIHLGEQIAKLQTLKAEIQNWEG